MDHQYIIIQNDFTEYFPSKKIFDFGKILREINFDGLQGVPIETFQ